MPSLETSARSTVIPITAAWRTRLWIRKDQHADDRDQGDDRKAAR